MAPTAVLLLLPAAATVAGRAAGVRSRLPFPPPPPPPIIGAGAGARHGAEADATATKLGGGGGGGGGSPRVWPAHASLWHRAKARLPHCE